MHVLIADDDKLIRIFLRKQVEDAGHTVELVENGPAAWDVLQRGQPPQIALLDWMMPGLSGVDVCQRLRAQSDRPYTYVIMATGRSSATDLVTGLDAGADDYLIKPVNPSELQARLRVAERIVGVQDELRNYAGQLEQLLFRHNLLGDLLVKHKVSKVISLDAAKPPAQAAAAAVVPARADSGEAVFMRQEDAWSNEAGSLRALRNLGEVVGRVCEQFGLAPDAGAPPATGQMGEPVRIGGTSFYLETLGRWIDLRLEIDGPSVLGLVQEVTQSLDFDPADSDPLLSEFINLLQRALKSALEAEGQRVIAPFVPKVAAPALAPADPGTGRATCVWASATVVLRMTLVECPLKEHSTPAAELASGDIHAEPLAVKKGAPPALGHVTAFTPMQVRSIQRWAEVHDKKLKLRTIAPSPWAKTLGLSSHPV
ncbi:MAG: response regulator transcription factor [Planctomycetes bacterium]|nr:response regulator transcription factor [Planctomycetota bacterium]